jgi:hypothetical protein
VKDVSCPVYMLPAEATQANTHVLVSFTLCLFFSLDFTVLNGHQPKAERVLKCSDVPQRKHVS